MEQSRENIPEQIYVPQKPIIPMYPNQISNPTPKLPERMTQNNRQTDLELDSKINRDFEEKFTILGRNNIRNIPETT